jgi:uncharacterized Rossmann fold enzyme
MNDSSVVVIGNGESRKDINLDKLIKKYIVIGCNAIHRDIVVDHLICCDHRMVREALKNPQTKNSLIYVRANWYHYFRKVLKNKNVNLLPVLPYQTQDRADRPEHWGSGPYAILLSASLGFEEINIVGFDLYGVNNKVNNIYKGTENYDNSTKQAVDYSYWVYQISKIFSLFPNIKFRVFNHSDWIMPEQWKKSNVEKINICLVDQLNNNYNNS